MYTMVILLAYYVMALCIPVKAFHALKYSRWAMYYHPLSCLFVTTCNPLLCMLGVEDTLVCMHNVASQPAVGLLYGVPVFFSHLDVVCKKNQGTAKTIAANV